MDAATTDDETGPTGLLERTLAVLEILALNAHGLQLFEIAEKLHIPRSATHRVLTSLAEHGYVRQERHQGAYLLTAKIASLAFTFLSGSGITDLAQPILDRLARETGELVRLALVDDWRLIWVAKSQGAQFGLRYDPDMGQEGRLSCSSSGHAWLATMTDEQAQALIEMQGIGSRQDYGPRAPQTWPAILKHLRQARKRGYAVVEQAYTPWMNAVATVIRSPVSGGVTGTVSVAGPHVRFTEARMHEIAPLLLAAAKELSLASAASPTLSNRRGNAQSDFFTSA